ncbi:MAG: type II toxin-antitoxin system RelE/ParE family toxin [Gammaproteobacteria bacterium]|nr:type II toxin-antitoxin system RelE/ParE family toxin [Gammaproteobacteria bacterium]
MKIYKNKQFKRWQSKNKISDTVIIKAIEEMENGLIDADLGGNLFKKRIAKAGMGKCGGYRTIVAMKQSTGWIFLFGFSKNESENINSKELTALKEYANDYLFVHLEELLKLEEIIEVLINE